jgi:ribosomal protein S18 acetylase RimI-like enzyme
MENELQTIEIRRLQPPHASDIYNLILHSDPKYYQYFTAFKANPEVITGFLSLAKRDQYLGFFVGNVLVGFFMLRGLDEGFAIPSYGVFISEKYQSCGLARLSVQYAFSFCKMNQIEKLMLKVHPSNKYALKIYREFGFVETGIDQSNNNLIFYKEIV